MSKQAIEIEVPDGWRAVEYRAPKVGEYYLSGVSDNISTATIGFASKHIILERDLSFEPIEVRLKPGWIAKNPDGEVWWYEDKPVIARVPNFDGSLSDDVSWTNIGDKRPSEYLQFEITDAVEIDLGDDWTKSLRRVV